MSAAVRPSRLAGIPQKCYICRGDKLNYKKQPEGMITCTGARCGHTGHPACWRVGHIPLETLGDAWTCDRCKKCEKCGSGEEIGFMHCNACDLGWHKKCVGATHITTEQEEKVWECPRCAPAPAPAPAPASLMNSVISGVSAATAAMKDKLGLARPAPPATPQKSPRKPGPGRSAPGLVDPKMSIVVRKESIEAAAAAITSVLSKKRRRASLSEDEDEAPVAGPSRSPKKKRATASDKDVDDAGSLSSVRDKSKQSRAEWETDVKRRREQREAQQAAQVMANLEKNRAKKAARARGAALNDSDARPASPVSTTNSTSARDPKPASDAGPPRKRLRASPAAGPSRSPQKQVAAAPRASSPAVSSKAAARTEPIWSNDMASYRSRTKSSMQAQAAPKPPVDRYQASPPAGLSARQLEKRRQSEDQRMSSPIDEQTIAALTGARPGSPTSKGPGSPAPPPTPAPAPRVDLVAAEKKRHQQPSRQWGAKLTQSPAASQRSPSKAASFAEPSPTKKGAGRQTASFTAGPSTPSAKKPAQADRQHAGSSAPSAQAGGRPAPAVGGGAAIPPEAAEAVARFVTAYEKASAASQGSATTTTAAAAGGSSAAGGAMLVEPGPSGAGSAERSSSLPPITFLPAPASVSSAVSIPASSPAPEPAPAPAPVQAAASGSRITASAPKSATKTSTPVASTSAAPAPAASASGSLGPPPSAELAPPPKRNRDQCKECKGSALANSEDEPEQLIVCAGCQSGWHPSCAGIEHMLPAVASYAWRCEDCTVCEVCGHQEETHRMACNTCDRSWHTHCVDLDSYPRGRWSCPTCTDPPESAANANSQSLPPPLSPPAPNPPPPSSQPQHRAQTPAEPQAPDQPPPAQTVDWAKEIADVRAGTNQFEFLDVLDDAQRARGGVLLLGTEMALGTEVARLEAELARVKAEHARVRDAREMMGGA